MISQPAKCSAKRFDRKLDKIILRLSKDSSFCRLDTDDLIGYAGNCDRFPDSPALRKKLFSDIHSYERYSSAIVVFGLRKIAALRYIYLFNFPNYRFGAAYRNARQRLAISLNVTIQVASFGTDLVY